ncbi:hypothetical protein VP01_1988g5 [Puccinia sorghi]|uniref:Uncharacterized protein n=1 Tax=Puccinia sorghi TaxID=27349 RepID=A0A0L6VBR3_9BASI|nr:hypothetical protein VP01_1988g5 [Puccinia sorghi]
MPSSQQEQPIGGPSQPILTLHEDDHGLEAAETDGGDDPERAALLGATTAARILHHKPTPIELRLAIFAFCCLCAASIGFGLFAGESSKLHNSLPPDSHFPPPQIITTTIFLSPTSSPSPPKKPSEICTSGPCVDAAGELRRTIQPPASEIISAKIDSAVEYILSGPSSTDATMGKIQAFKTMCERKGSRPPYSEYFVLLEELSEAWKRTTRSKADKVGAVLAYLHAAALPALFQITVTSKQLTLAPHVVSLEGLEEAFPAIYPAEQVSERLQAVQKLAASLARLTGHSGPSQLVTVDELQALSCSALPSPCWIYWKDFYSALHPHMPIGLLDVHGIDYFAHLARVIAEQADMGLESYFHWLIIISMRRKDCQGETKLEFGPTLLKKLFLRSEEQQREMQSYLSSARFLLQFMLDQSPHSDLPRVIEGPPAELDQTAELAAIQEDNWVLTLHRLALIKTRRALSEGTLRWNVLDTKPVLQAPLLYPSSPDLPKSLIFGSFGYMLYEKLWRLQLNGTVATDEGQRCGESLRASFSDWKRYRAANGPHQSRTRLVGLPDHLGAPDQLFFLAFGRLEMLCVGDEQNE